MDRRTFIRYIGVLTSAAIIAPELHGCSDKSTRGYNIRRLGADHKSGHLLRNTEFLLQQPIAETIETPLLIVGGGVSGLSTAYHLNKLGNRDFILLEMAHQTGGNSAGSSNSYSAFPLGAHYLPLINPGNKPLAAFLKETGVITETTKNDYSYNELYLSHSPHERLFYRGIFQESLIPHYGITKDVEVEISRFLRLMQTYRDKTDDNDKYLFDIPLSMAGNSSELEELDKITFSEFLKTTGFKSEELLWYLDYCTRDDFGAGPDRVSALAGIRYFAARRPCHGNAAPGSVMTWPEGNSFLVKHLEKPVSGNIRTNYLVFSVEETPDGISALALDLKTNHVVRFQSENCVLACPSYVTQRILRSDHWNNDLFGHYKHHPWLVGTITTNKPISGNGHPLSWDNVRYGSRGLGYIHNQNQSLKQQPDHQVITAYYAFDLEDDQTERKQLFRKTDDELAAILIRELRQMHPDIEESIQSVTLQLWGHGMVTPYPGTFQLYKQFHNRQNDLTRIYPAHTDYMGYSVFEEGFDIGYRLAQQLTKIR